MRTLQPVTVEGEGLVMRSPGSPPHSAEHTTSPKMPPKGEDGSKPRMSYQGRSKQARPYSPKCFN